MLRIYFLSAWRNLKKNKMVSFINILGLTVGLACAVLAIVYSYHELTYEDCHEKADRICRVYVEGDFGSIKWIPTTWGPEGEAIKNLYPEVEKTSISRNVEAIVRVGDHIFIEKQILFADSNFFSILTIPFIEGTPSSDPQTVVISEKTANKYFGNPHVLDKTMLLKYNDKQYNLQITGIYKDLPSNTEVQTDFIIPFSLGKTFPDWRYKEYNSTSFINMVLLKPGTNIKELNKKIVTGYKIPVNITNIKAFLMPIKEVHLNGSYSNNYGKFLAFLIGGIMVLVISCINYINLTNILFSARNREIGTRIINGAQRFHIFRQFIVDTVLFTGIGFLFALVILQFILPKFNVIMDTHITLTPSWELVLAFASIFVITVLLSGVYPAIKISASKSIDYLKNQGSSLQSKNKSLWVLTTVQFMVAVLFIQVILVLNTQNKHLTNAETLGFNADNVICINGTVWGNLDKVKAELLKNPSIVAVSWANSLPSIGMSVTTDWKDKDNKESATQLYVEEDYLKVYQIKMESGHFFSKEFPSELKNGIVINRKTADALGFTDPVGKYMNIYDKQYKIIGIVGEYMSVPPIFNEMPQLIRTTGERSNYLTIRINPESKAATHAYIKQVLQKYNPDYPVDIKYHFEVGEELEEAKSYYAASNLINTFFIITIITALFGLFGLSVFIAERYRKEIGIRKVCGASIAESVTKLSRGLIVQLMVAILLASPIAFMVSRLYLSIFPEHIELNAFLFFKGAFLAFVLMLLTVSWQNWLAATRNPIESLRYE